jgi:hypothetical protein
MNPGLPAQSLGLNQSDGNHGWNPDRRPELNQGWNLALNRDPSPELCPDPSLALNPNVKHLAPNHAWSGQIRVTNGLNHQSRDRNHATIHRHHDLNHQDRIHRRETIRHHGAIRHRATIRRRRDPHLRRATIRHRERNRRHAAIRRHAMIRRRGTIHRRGMIRHRAAIHLRAVNHRVPRVQSGRIIYEEGSIRNRGSFRTCPSMLASVSPICDAPIRS